MPAAVTTPLSELYLEDETAWLDRMAELVRARRAGEIDWENLGELLSDMARRDRREVESRLTALLAHTLKWAHRPGRRTNGWRATIVEQRQELALDAGRGVPRRHAEESLGEAYARAVQRAAAETGLPEAAFPAECPYSLAEALAFEPKEGEA